MSAILFRYVLRVYAGLFFGALAAILSVFLIADYSDRLRTFLNRPFSDVAELYWYKLLVSTHQLAPTAMLVAAGAAASILRKRGEWTAMQSVGASRATVVLPIVLLGLGFTVTLVAYDEWVVTVAGPRIDRLHVERFNRWGDYRFYYTPAQWFRVNDDVFQVRGDREADGTVHDLTLFRMAKEFGVAERYDVGTLRPQGGARWLLEGVTVRSFEGGGHSTVLSHAQLELELRGTHPYTFNVQLGRPEHMRVADLLRQEEVRASVGLPTRRYRLALHNRFAYPATGLAATVLSLMLALRPSRQGHLTVVLAESLGVIVLLFMIMGASKTLTLSGHLPPSAAAWAPSVGLLIASLLLWLRVEGRFPFRPRSSVREATR